MVSIAQLVQSLVGKGGSFGRSHLESSGGCLSGSGFVRRARSGSEDLTQDMLAGGAKMQIVWDWWDHQVSV